ncbi:MAG TPA: TonB family protein [Burkholderiaceae bacterium]|nr:TonB family protein [Burkholderiaceae bacterium]
MFAPAPLSVRLRNWRPSVMQLALTISISLHAAVLGVRFVDPEDFNRVFQDTPLEVVLVNARSTEAPTKAQAIAQANLAGGGEAEAGIATSPLPPSPSELVGDDQSDASKEIQQQQQEQQQLLTQIRRDVAAMPVPDPRRASTMTQAERETEQLRQQKLRLLAAIEKRINEENSRPRRRYISPSTREEVYAIYYDKLRHKIEDKGTANFPTLNGHKLYGELTVNLTIDARGRIVESEIVHSSNSRFLDQRALAIAQAATPFGNFSDEMKRKADQIVVTSRFRFTKTEGMQATMTTNGG